MAVDIRRKKQLAETIVESLPYLESMLRNCEPGILLDPTVAEIKQVTDNLNTLPGKGVRDSIDAGLINVLHLHSISEGKSLRKREITVLNPDNLKQALGMKTTTQRSI